MQKNSKRVLFGGVFDLLHYAHIQAIKRAKSYGYLILNVSSDKQVKRKKGESRPIIPEAERIAILQELRDVDEVVCMDTEELDLEALISVVKPDILITNDDNSEYDTICARNGVEIIKLPRIISDSKLDTSKIIHKIKVC